MRKDQGKGLKACGCGCSEGRASHTVSALLAAGNLGFHLGPLQGVGVNGGRRRTALCFGK